MDANIHKQNNFSRLLSNEEKLGAYYTDLGMCRRINNLFSFEEDKEYAIIEPSIGDASAVKAVVGKTEGDNKVLFGVELNPETFEKVSKDTAVSYLLNTDFLNGVTITNNAFSFCFMNPPYGTDYDNKERLETLFVAKVTGYIKTGGLLCAVIPDYVFEDDRFLRTYLARFEHVSHYRFDDDVYEQFKQVVVVGRRKSGIWLKKEVLDAMREHIADTTSFPYLPTTKDEPIVVPSSNSARVDLFTTLKFNAPLAYEKMREASPIYSSKKIGAKTAVSEFCTVEFGEPILPPSPSMCYLMATVGGGAGLCGTEGSLHLQRGCAEIVKQEREEVDESGNVRIVEVSRTQMTLKLIENDGKISSF